MVLEHFWSIRSVFMDGALLLHRVVCGNAPNVEDTVRRALPWDRRGRSLDGDRIFPERIVSLAVFMVYGGFMFSAKAGVIPWGSLGVYGLGFSAFLLAGWTFERCLKAKVGTLCVIALLVHWPWLNPLPIAARGVKVAGIQLEFPPDLQIPKQLDRLLERHPDAQIIVLSEYTFDGPVPKHVREWCRRNGRYLIAGGKEDVAVDGKGAFRNTAFVIGPDGELVFQQCKSVPIQFFNDGLPAKEQRVWHSPWGKVAVPVCYDLSYRRVTDRFVRDGAEAFIVPFMDVTEWGIRQHEQHRGAIQRRAATLPA